MSIPYIEMRCNLWTNPKVRRMARDANTSIASIVGGLHWFWSQVHEHGEGNRIASLTPDLVDGSVGVPGFAKVGVEAGWIAFDEDGAMAPRWNESTTANAKERQRVYEAKRKLQWRKRLAKAGIEESPHDVPDIGGTCPGQVRDCPPQTELNSTKLNKTDLSKTKQSKKPPDVPSGFLEFWNAYPPGTRRKNKPGSLKSWHKQGCEDVTEAVLKGLRKWKSAWEKDDNKYVPLVTTWLNARDWETPPKVVPEYGAGMTHARAEEIFRNCGIPTVEPEPEVPW